MHQAAGVHEWQDGQGKLLMAKDEDHIYYDAKGRAHHHHVTVSSPDRHHSRHHHHHRRPWQTVLLVVVSILVAVVVVALAAWRVMDALGKRSLYGNVSSSGPSLSESSAAAASETAEAEAEAANEGEEWKAGWVRYQGSVYEYNSDIMTFLFLGVDKMGTVAAGKNGIDGGQADGQFLLILNPDTKKVQILAINRNTMTDVDVYNEDGSFRGTYRLQICLQHGYGDGLEQSCERAEKAVSNLLYDLPINGYCALNMGGIASLVDSIGGITVPRMTFEDGQITKGEDETLNGTEAYNYVHYRSLEQFDSATFRLEKQKEFLKAFMAKMKDQLASNPTVALDLYNVAKQYIVTDIDTSEMVYLAGQVGNYSFDSDIYSLKGTTIPETEGTTGHEEFNYDEDALYDLMIQLFYRKVK